MKPLPTLTKPLRSVDIESKEPAEALRERTDSCTVPAAGVVGEAMLALELARAAREKFGGDAMEDVLAAFDALPGADRVAKLVVIGFMAAGKSTFARELGRASRAGPWPTPTRSWRSGWGSRSPSSSIARARPRSASASRRWCSSCSGSPEPGVVALGGGAVESEAVRAALDGHVVVHVDVDLETAWERANRSEKRPLARDREAFAALYAQREPLYGSTCARRS